MLERILVNVREAAYLLSVSPRHTMNLVKDGVIHPVRLGRRLLFDPQHLKEVAAQFQDRSAAQSQKEAPSSDVRLQQPN
ncbi:MAG: helix-turn-helix domain-containing protein [Candidatus Freyarchaeota archaeon]|nr:helix-turn-helix domain-containing protein [Candidatus Jordarchaeia archaeon]MBS7281612.1 helix-turn-helix domain-containing protein [Candidatus Jordarchaeia archaeon]